MTRSKRCVVVVALLLGGAERTRARATLTLRYCTRAERADRAWRFVRPSFYSRQERSNIYQKDSAAADSPQISPGTNTAGTFFLYAAQSSPYLSEQKWSSRTARWMSSTAK